MNAFEWAQSADPTEPPTEFYCPLQDIWIGRFQKIAPELIRAGCSEDFAAPVAAMLGELGDNCFAHNAPGWIDISGCWFEYKVTDRRLHFVIADRGRGILGSLHAVRHELSSHVAALEVALTERISGRAPEKRGNGLKTVTKELARLSQGSFVLQSGDAEFQCELPLDLGKISEYIQRVPVSIRGTFVEGIIMLSYAR